MLELRGVPADQEADRRSEVVQRVSGRRITGRYLDADEARRQVETMYDDLAERSAVHDVVDPATGDRVGHAWIVREREETSVYDVRLDESDRATELVPGLLDLTRRNGSRMLSVSSGPDQATAAVLATAAGFEVRATNMVLELDGDIADPGLELRPMTPEEFAAFSDALVVDYADTLAEAGLSQEAAMERSREQAGQLMPQGQDSPGMEFFTGWVGGDPVGRLWLNVDKALAFVYDVEVLEEQRRRGHGAGLMNAAAIWSREQGHPALGLNVFAHNPGARALYDKLGYRVTSEYYSLDVVDA